MKQRSTSLGPLGIKFFALMQLNNQDKVRTGDLLTTLGLSPKQERELLSRLCKKGLIVRLQRSLYSVPAKIPPGEWMPNEYTLISELMENIQAEYFISGPLAFHYYGLVSQIPNVITVYNNKISGFRKVGNLTLELIRVSPNRLGGWTTFELPNGKSVRIATLARTFLDALYDWNRFNTIPRVYEWLSVKRKDRKLLREIVSLSLKYGNIGTRRRLGYTLETLGVEKALLEKLKRATPKSRGWIPLIPTLGMKGKTDKDWRLILNA